MDNNLIEHLKTILDIFGYNYNICEYKTERPPHLVIVVNPSMDRSDVGKEYIALPAYAFHVEIISGSEYMTKYSGMQISNINDVSDTNGWYWFDQKGYCAYDYNANILIGFPYPNEEDLPLSRAIVHEMGHYKQQMQFNAKFSDVPCENLILEYHNIMVNENTVYSKEKDYVENDAWYKGYRVKYCIPKPRNVNPKNLPTTIGFASNKIQNLLENNYSDKTKSLLKDMLEFAKAIETTTFPKENARINILNLLVNNMCTDIKNIKQQ